MPVPLLEIQPSQSSTANVSLSRRSFGSPLYERQTKTHQQQVINGPLPPESPLSLLSPYLSPSYSSSEVLPAGSSRWSPPTGLAPFLSAVSIRQRGKAPGFLLRGVLKTHHPAAEAGGSADGWMRKAKGGGGRRRGRGAPACGCSSFAISLLKGTDRAENSSQCVANNFPV